MKKGSIMSFEVLVGTILVLVFIFFFTFYSIDSTQKAIDKTERDLCLASVKRAESLRFFKSDSIVPIDCRTRFVEIKEDKVLFSGAAISDSGNQKRIKDNTKLKSKRSGNTFTFYVDSQKELMKVFADEMAGCWYQMGSGNVNMFGNFDGDKRCVICSEISIDPKLATKYKTVGLEGDSFQDFLKENQFSTPIFQAKYSEVLKIEEGIVGFGEVGDQKSFPNIVISDAKGTIPYSVIFSMYNENQLLESVGGSTILAGAVCIGGAAIAIKTLGLGIPVAIAACTGVTAAGTTAGIVYNDIRTDEKGVQYYPAWYIKPAAEAVEAGCSQLY